MATSDIISVLQALGFLVAGIVAVRTFTRDSGLKRSEWLERLHDKFYGQENYKYIRRALDYSSDHSFEQLKDNIVSRGYSDNVEKLVDYLNFFHFIATLWDTNQLTEKEIRSLFNYYLKLLTKHDFIVDYMEREEFYLLLRMLRSFSMLPKKKK
ncbi:MAG: hypothetical protein AAGI89_15110 [Pseudomonadota bacterium]